MIVLILKMLLAMAVPRRWLFWWGLFWFIINIDSLDVDAFDLFPILARIISCAFCVMFMVLEFKNELEYVRAAKYKGPRW